MRRMYSENQIESKINQAISELQDSELVLQGTTYNDEDVPAVVDFGKVVYDTDLSEGLYLFTYANCYAFVTITPLALLYARESAIKVSMPCVYDGSGSFRPGTLVINSSAEEDEGGTPTGKYILSVRVVDGTGAYFANGLGFNVYKTNLM